MKIHFSKFSELSCFTVRESIAKNELKMLKLGFDQLLKDLEEMLVINLVNAQISPEFLPGLIEYKKNISKLTTQKVFWITKEKGLGDAPKLELLLSRFQGSKMRQVCDRIILDDKIYELENEIATVHAQIEKLGFDETTSKKAIQKNTMAKVQKNALDACLKFQKKRQTKMKAVPSNLLI